MRNDGEKETGGEEKTQVGVSTMYISHEYFSNVEPFLCCQFVDISKNSRYYLIWYQKHWAKHSVVDCKYIDQ